MFLFILIFSSEKWGVLILLVMFFSKPGLVLGLVLFFSICVDLHKLNQKWCWDTKKISCLMPNEVRCMVVSCLGETLILNSPPMKMIEVSGLEGFENHVFSMFFIGFHPFFDFLRCSSLVVLNCTALSPFWAIFLQLFRAFCQVNLVQQLSFSKSCAECLSLS